MATENPQFGTEMPQRTAVDNLSLAKRQSVDIFAALTDNSNESENLRWSGSFREYLEKVVEDPKMVRSSHGLLYDALISRENFFETGRNALFGAEEPTGKLLEVLHASAQGLEVRKRIILLMGPPGGGKSTMVNAMKRGLEQFTKTEDGVVYAISDCPMNEDPLHLIPEEKRQWFEDTLGVHIEGDLCPHCNQKYGNLPMDQLLEGEGDGLPQIKRVVFSERNRVGIGVFKPSDPKSQDITELIGSVDWSKLPEHGTSSDPRAYRFDGELNIANRGMMEFVEMLKSDERFLYALLDLTQDRVIKAPRFANISADEVIVAHTNETEYANYVGNNKNEALRDRMIVIPVPYNLRVSDERQIYEKLIGESSLIRGESPVHISPHALNIAATFAVLSRLEDPKKAGVSLIQKMKIYDGQETHETNLRDVKELREAAPREGMHGLSPRYVIDSLSSALIKGNPQCITPIDTMRALRDNLNHHPHTRDMKKEDKDRLVVTLLPAVQEEFNELAKREVQSAFVYSFGDNARTLSENYLDSVDAFVNKAKITDPITDEETEPDEKLMKSIEDQIGITDAGKREWRQEIMTKMASLARRGESFDYTSHPKLREAIEKKLFSDVKDVIRLTTATKVPDQDQQRRIGEVQQTLIDEKGYCEHCADELLRYVSTLLQKQ